MTQVFTLPDPGEGIHEAEILDVLVSQGDAVREGEIVLQIETDKAVIEVPSPFTGTVAEMKVTKGDMVRVGEVLMTFTTGEPRQAPERQQPRQPAAEAQEVEQPPQQVAAAQTNGHPVPAAPATRRLAMELGVDLQAVPGSGPGGRVTAEDVRAFAGKSKTDGAIQQAAAREAEERAQEDVSAAKAPEAQAVTPRPG